LIITARYRKGGTAPGIPLSLTAVTGISGRISNSACRSPHRCSVYGRCQRGDFDVRRDDNGKMVQFHGLEHFIFE
jgi:hypothetical protein